MNMKNILPFAGNGYEKMLYDNRMGPQAVLHKGVIYVVYHAHTV